MREDYKDYEDYLFRQLRSRNNPEKIAKKISKRKRRIKWFNERFSVLDGYVIKGSKALCLGARLGEEVEVLRDRGFAAVGIDLVGYPPLVIAGDFHKIPFKDNSFDFIYSNSVDHVFDIEKFSSEVNRVLKKGGYVLFHLLAEDVKDVLSCFSKYEVIRKRFFIKRSKGLSFELILRNKMKWIINYFDLGVHMGREIDFCLKETQNNSIIKKVNVYGFEGHIAFCTIVQKRYENNPCVRIINKVIGPCEKKVEFYLTASKGHSKAVEPVGEHSCGGSSIYEDKKNVSRLYFFVKQIPFSIWLRRNDVKLKGSNVINIIKANIEGAEYDLICDMEKNDLFRHFDLFLGSSLRSNSWLDDVGKVKSLKSKIGKLNTILKKNGVVCYQYRKPKKDGSTKGNININEFINKIIGKKHDKIS